MPSGVLDADSAPGAGLIGKRRIQVMTTGGVGTPVQADRIRAVAEDIILMEGWSNGPTLSNGGKRWDATKLGTQLATDVFKTRAPGLRY